jgi:dihydroxyacid dehydratase/phosphogluconate dehydratase
MAFGGVLEDALKGVHGPDGTILHSSENPLEKNGCFAILCGSLAPKGAMVKRE